MDISLPDEEFYVVQEKLKKWICVKGFVNWIQIHKACLQLLSSYDEAYQELYGNYPEYKLFMPLLRNGICEVSLDKKLLFCIYNQNSPAEDFDPLLVLNNFPKIETIIKTFEEDDSYMDFRFICDLYDGYAYKICEKPYKIGIYKTQDEVYSPAYLYDGKSMKKIPELNKSLDGINIARQYVRKEIMNQKLFEYHATQKKLYCHNYSELPIIVSRCLVLFDKEQLEDRRFLFPLNFQISYKNIPETAINELARIFGKNTVEVIND